MKLHCTITSPFARKVWVVAHETGLSDRIERIPTNPHRDEYLRQDNPLCRVPTLILDNGETLYDSPVICEYLDSLHQGKKLFPPEGLKRWRALRLQALGDGIMDANLARRMESLRPQDKQLTRWSDRQRQAAEAAYTWLESNSSVLGDPDGDLTIGDVSVACALGYLAVRFPDEVWETRYSRLAEWNDAIKHRPSIEASDYQTLKHTLPASLVKEGPSQHI